MLDQWNRLSDEARSGCVGVMIFVGFIGFILAMILISALTGVH